MLKYPCLILDHDDTVVQSEASVNYPCFCRYLEVYRPGMTMSLAEYVEDCSRMSFVDMCKMRFSLTDEEMYQEYLFWQDYARTHIPDVFPGIGEILSAYREAGGILCVVSMSAKEQILRDYLHHFGLCQIKFSDANCRKISESQVLGHWSRFVSYTDSHRSNYWLWTI